MNSPVTKLAGELVIPCEQTPSNNLPLSSLDHALDPRFFIEMISVYGHGLEQPAKAIRGALSKALVPYYPVAGRLVMSDEGKLEVACTGDGVWFAEATTHHSLGDLKNIEFVLPKEELLPCPPPSLNQEDMILMMQVTQFNCGGFVVGIKFSHMVFDGIGAGQLLKAVGEIARGLAPPTVDPIWSREAIPAPPKLPREPPMTATFGLVPSLWDFPLHSINKIKEEFMRETSHRCTTFEVITAVLWRCRARAINLELHADVHLVFPTNVRPFLHQLLPPEGGYYGNCLYCVTVTATSEKIMHAPLFEIVSLIRDAKASLPAKFSEWARGDFKEDPYKFSIGYEALTLSDWRSVGFYEVDYGVGVPHRVAPLNDLLFACAFILKRPAPKQGVRFVGHVVKKEHEGVLVKEMKKFV